MKEQFLEADVLCVGGGIAGLMAGIRASTLGARVIIAEKANTLRSGNGATGNDHFRCYIPEYHGPDIQPFIAELAQSQAGTGKPLNLLRVWMEHAFDIVKLWDAWGIPMKYGGQWEFAGHAFPGRPLTSLKYSGKQQKPILTREAIKSGAVIVNRVMVFDLLCDDSGVTGAIGIDTREDKLVTFLAKSVILTTGKCTGLYPSPTPGWMFNRANFPGSTGDGRAMAYRAGAELMNLELPQRWAGPKYFCRCGKATWIGVIRDPQDKPVGPFVTRPERRYGDAISDVYHSLFEDYIKSGQGPTYMDCRGISDEDLEYMTYFLEQEGNEALLDYLRLADIDLRKNPVEFMTYELATAGAIRFNAQNETSLAGLYAAGDEYFGGISGAATFGWLAGENAAKYAKQRETSGLCASEMRDKVEETKSRMGNFLNRQEGVDWSEARLALEQIMGDYAGTSRSETMLKAGYSHLQRLKAKTGAMLMAKNQHELMHCLELFNLLDIGELVFTAALERKESRNKYIRTDYPFTNPLLNNKHLVCCKVAGKPITEWK